MFRKALPHIVALAVFAIVSMIYFAPQYEGRVVRQGDEIQAQGMKGGIEAHKEAYGEHPQWAPNMFSGMPAYLIDMNYDGRLVKHTGDLFYFLGKPAGFYFVLMAGFYLMLLIFGVDPWVAISGSLAYGLSSYFIIIFEAGHITKLMAMAWAAPMVGAVFLAYRRNLWLGASLAAFFGSVEISCSHPQISYYFLFVLVGLVAAMLYEAIKSKTLKRFAVRTAVLVVAGILAVGSNIVQLYYINDYSKESTRSATELKVSDAEMANRTDGLDRDYITAWSYGKVETFNLLIPNLMGGTSSGGFSDGGKVAEALRPYNASSLATHLPGYWGPQPMTSGPVYIGAVIIFLAVMGLFLLKGSVKWWLAGVTLLAVMLAWGKNFMWLTDLFIDYVPAYDKFRTVSMILVIVQWSVPLLAMLGVREVMGAQSPEARLKVGRAIRYSLFITGGIALFFIVLGGFFLDFSGEYDTAMGLPDDILAAMRDERASLMRTDAFRSLVLIVFTAGFVSMSNRGKLTAGVTAVALSALVLLDMIPVDKRYLDYDKFVARKEAVGVAPSEADRIIMSDPDPDFRVANLTVSTFADATASYFHKSVGGYHAAKLRRYQEFADRYLAGGDLKGFDMLNTKYFIQRGENGEPEARYNDGALGNAWFVEDVVIVDNANEELDAIAAIDPAVTAVVDKRFMREVESLHADSSSVVELTDWRANRLTYKASTSSDALAVFSEIYYPRGWRATIDGAEVPVMRADYILRALEVPAGEHEIVFSFAAPHFGLLKGVTAASSAIILLGTLLSLALCVFKARRSNEQTA
ncbi:MAG: YfhO family protein [Rikenellaceae bacterium]|nr:YfhO family protein [Rikenellaceae bacterium]